MEALKRAWLVLVPVLMLLLAAGCGMDQEQGILMAAGSYGDLAVVYSSAELEPLARKFADEVNERMVFVIQEETRFKIDVLPPEKSDLAKGYKNSVFILDVRDKGPVVKAARKVLSKDAWDKLAASPAGLVQRKDPWSNYQLLVVAAGTDRNSLGSLLHRSAARIRHSIEDDNRKRILRRNRYDGLATELMNAIWTQYGFTLEIPAAYHLNQQSHDGVQGIELMRTGPSRGITIAWKDVPDPEAWLADREQLLAFRAQIGKVFHHEELVPESFHWDEQGLPGSGGVKLTGAWSGSSFAGGGPFWAYFLAVPEQGRIYCLDTLAYAPGMDKMLFFRRLEAIASTFTTTRPQP